MEHHRLLDLRAILGPNSVEGRSEKYPPMYIYPVKLWPAPRVRRGDIKWLIQLEFCGSMKGEVKGSPGVQCLVLDSLRSRLCSGETF